MILSWPLLALLLAVGFVAWFWQNSLGARERANAAALEACQQLGLQFLDGTVAFARISVARGGGFFRLKRTYVFDYTATSIERRQGFVVLLGNDVQSVGYERDEVRGQPIRTAERPPTPAQIVHLQEWKERSRTDSERGNGTSQ
ncbi:MAG TPA: DUF3301 domain-containing protein [Steroidobacteraceae bacterium]|jgi:hypothetical protein|nr:DUF3301 domain-containing protein [Steroidobacteraceae bacterium]